MFTKMGKNKKRLFILRKNDIEMEDSNFATQGFDYIFGIRMFKGV
jgi:hypothetical protein